MKNAGGAFLLALLIFLAVAYLVSRTPGGMALLQTHTGP